MTLHEMLDVSYGRDGDKTLRRMLEEGFDPNARAGARGETALHVAARRRRCNAVEILLDHGAEIDATTAGGKTAYAHSVRRGFDDVADILRRHGANTDLNRADQLATLIVEGRMVDARQLLVTYPEIARTGNPEEDRLLADVAGREDPARVEFLIRAGADLAARGLDDGTPLHQAAWFGQPLNARLLLDAGAPLDVFGDMHNSSPLGWAVHGARYSGGADKRQDEYVKLVEMLLTAGATFDHPEDPGGDRYLHRLLEDATPRVRAVLERRRG
jgi:cytohesin